MTSHLLHHPQAIEFFFFAACIGAVAIVSGIMAFFYKYVDLSTYNQLPDSENESDETSALIMDKDKEQQENYDDHKGSESEF